MWMSSQWNWISAKTAGLAILQDNYEMDANKST